jgi:hypothetical protein
MLICDMVHNNNNSKNNNDVITISIPLTGKNVVSLIILFCLILCGSYFLWNIMTRNKCSCKVCKNEYLLEEKLGEGGFGEVILFLYVDI